MRVNESENEYVARDFIATLVPHSTATTLGFRGDLGAGKTTFTKAIAKVVGVAETITSPTFVILKNYKITQPTTHFTTLTHIDAYRLDSGDELEKLKFNELLTDSDRLIIVEWPENVTSALPNNTQYIDFSVLDEQSREITGLMNE